jgi:hypothetical protein
MQTIMTRAVVPGVLLVGGIASLIYGARFHDTPVFEEKEIEEKISVPFAMPPFAGPETPPWEQPPELALRTEKRKVLVSYDQSEPVLIRDVTVGGVVVLASGDLMRTYSGKLPTLCPT